MFDAKDGGVTELQKNLDTLISSMPKESRKVLQDVGNKATNIARRVARREVNEHTGYYHKKFKRGKVYDAGVGDYRTRVYNNAPHAHLLEDGHRIIGKDGSEHGFQHGYKILEKANKEIEEQWDEILEKSIDKIIDKM